jgi:pilus assembly protein Flp/PilA
MSKFVAFLKNESGATAIEYGLIAAGISIAIIAVVNIRDLNAGGYEPVFDGVRPRLVIEDGY